MKATFIATMEVIMVVDTMQCPFVYAKGHRCEGHVYRFKAYGPQIGEGLQVRKVRFWCSEKDDHCAPMNIILGKERMEFYPDEIPADLKARVFEVFARGEYDSHR